jgi:ABC-type antimicrobial peptide transport system permease subunit
MDLHLLQGRFFSKDLASDYSTAVIVNQAFVDRFNINSPVGKLVNLREGKRFIIGVIGNVIVSVDKGYEIVPELYLPATDDESINLVVKTSGQNNAVIFNDLADTWKKLIPFRPFPGFYQDSMSLGSSELTSRNLKTIFIYMGIIGALLSLTGVFALSALNVSGRIKEIGIRKVMGANSKKILFFMNQQFILSLGISIIAGMILSYFFINNLLSRIYEYRTPVSVTILFFIGFIVFFLAVLTTSSSTYKASITNPSKILRSE